MHFSRPRRPRLACGVSSAAEYCVLVTGCGAASEAIRAQEGLPRDRQRLTPASALPHV
jgi:hypothetical protein